MESIFWLVLIIFMGWFIVSAFPILTTDLSTLYKDREQSKRDAEHAVRRAKCEGTKIPPSQTKKIIGVIYDTSFLMSDAIRPILNAKVSLEGEIDPMVGVQICKEYFYFADHFLKAEVIPYEVLQEIQTHFSNPEKSKSAKQARGRVIEMVKEGVDEVDLSGVSVSRESKSIIGADSVTDRKLIAYALFKLDNGWDYALIVTNDGGIVYDVLKLNQQGRKITTYPFEESEFFLQLTDLMGLNWRDDASWHIDISREA